MIKYLSNNITDFFYLNNIINEEEKEIYVYGLQLIISTVIGITLIASLGLFLNIFVKSLIFLISFIWIRMYSGGYHASSYIKCNLTFVTVYLMTMAITIITPPNYIMIASLVMISLTLYIILKYAPVDHENKRLSDEQKRINKKITLQLLFLFYLIAAVMYKIGNQLFYTIIVTMFMVSSLIFVKIKHKEVF